MGSSREEPLTTTLGKSSSLKTSEEHQGPQPSPPPVFTLVLEPILEYQVRLALSALGHWCSHLELGRLLLAALGKEA